MGLFDILKEKIPFFRKEDSPDWSQADETTQPPAGEDPFSVQQPTTDFQQTPNANAQQSFDLGPMPTQQTFDQGFQNNQLNPPNPYSEQFPPQNNFPLGSGSNNFPTNPEQGTADASIKLILAKLEAMEMYLKSIDARLTAIETLLRQRMNSPYY